MVSAVDGAIRGGPSAKHWQRDDRVGGLVEEAEATSRGCGWLYGPAAADLAPGVTLLAAVFFCKVMLSAGHADTQH